MVQIYTLATGTWRNITNPGPGSVCFSLSVFVNGPVHWIASIEDDYIIHVILSFYIRDNTFHEMALPVSLDDVNKLQTKTTFSFLYFHVIFILVLIFYSHLFQSLFRKMISILVLSINVLTAKSQMADGVHCQCTKY